MKKYRFFIEKNKVVLIENNREGEYSKKKFPHIYLKDPNKPELGYRDDIPEWFVMEWNGEGEIESMKVKRDKDGNPIGVYECKKLCKCGPKAIREAIKKCKEEIASGKADILKGKEYIRKIFMKMKLNEKDKKEILKDYGK